MISKKAPNSSEEKKLKLLYTLCGLILSLSFVLCVFEHKSIQYLDTGLNTTTLLVDDEPVFEIEKEIIQPPKPLIQPPKPPEFSKVAPAKPKKIAPEITKEKKHENEIIFPDLFLEPDTVVFIDSIFEVVEESPSFPGGVAKLYEFLSKQLRYPEMAKENGIQGKVFVQFVVCKDGSIKDVKVIKSIHNTLDKEASRVVKRMPKWSPGKQRGKAVNTKFTLPIKFKIS